MLRHSRLVVLTILTLAFLPISTFAAGQPDCPDGALAAILGPAGETGGEATLAPQYDPQNKVCIFLCEPWYTTSMKRGTGSDCTAAHNNLASQVSSEASSTGPGLCNAGGATFGYCGYILRVTVACHWDFVLGLYVEDGYGDIKCKDYC